MRQGSDFYCDQVLSGRTEVERVRETANVLAYHHTRSFYPVHIVVFPKRHVDSLLTLDDAHLRAEIVDVIQDVAGQVVEEYGACRVLTNLGDYQDSKHLHWHVIYGEALQ